MQNSLNLDKAFIYQVDNLVEKWHKDLTELKSKKHVKLSRNIIAVLQ